MTVALDNTFKILVISLSRELTRRQHVVGEMKREGISFEFIDAIDGRAFFQPPKIYDSSKRRLRYGYDLSNGEIACFLSHRKAWMLCHQSKTPCLIFEDDVCLGQNFKRALEIISNFPGHFELFRLAGLTVRPRSRVLVKRYGDLAVAEELKDPGGSAAYVLTPEGADKLLRNSESFDEPVDNFIEARWVHGLLSYAVVPYPVLQNTLESTIADRLGTKKTLSLRMRRLVFRALSDWRRLVWSWGRRVHFFFARSKSCD